MAKLVLILNSGFFVLSISIAIQLLYGPGLSCFQNEGILASDLFHSQTLDVMEGMTSKVEVEATGLLHLARLGIVSVFCHSLGKLPLGHPTICCSLFVVDVCVVSAGGSVVFGVDVEVVATLGAFPQIYDIFRLTV